MTIQLLARHQVRLLTKNPGMIALFIIGPVFIIFIIGQALAGVFENAGMGIQAMDYFGATILTLAVFQGTSIAAWGMLKEKKSNTESRLALSPVRKEALLWGTFLGTWLFLGILSFIVLFLLKNILSVHYGPSTPSVLLLLAAESFLASAAGVSLAVLLEKEKAANAVISSLVPVLIFIGGGYSPLPESGFLHDLAIISPIRWLNLALLTPSEDPVWGSYMTTAIFFCLALATLFLGITTLKLRRSA